MYPMTKRSLGIRLAILPVFLVMWFIAGIVLIGLHIFEFLCERLDKLRDRFEAWINRVAPLGK